MKSIWLQKIAQKSRKSVYFSKEQDLEKVIEFRPPLFFNFRGGHTSSTFSNSCSVLRYAFLGLKFTFQNNDFWEKSFYYSSFYTKKISFGHWSTIFWENRPTLMWHHFGHICWKTQEQWCWYWHFCPSGVGSQEACYSIQSSVKPVFSMLVWKVFHLVGASRSNSEQKNRNIFSLQTQGVLASSQKLNLCTVSSSIPFILVIFNHVFLVILCL